ncbi:D-alanine--D-alanine ligase [Marinibactrum halimedae]|uniref:D-alanine--D-alanine ligase n=1 Tax=Marinibactrum halimedae TaxID=1444977 RepID=UPI001E3C1977|nr:D-alanine--D-alanine ligase [Marinibactrum halimedae]MCD9459607.1 D-alanine--D-alanine ligase [Marinibactrum halimedae]
MTELTSTESKQFGRVGVLYGGISAEREVSMNSGKAVSLALKQSGVDVVDIDINEKAIEQIKEANIDRAFIILHGAHGEDGRIQALLEFMGIPYTGSRVQACSLAMDKLRTKWLWQGIGLPTPDFRVLSEKTDWERTLLELGGAVMVKPAHEGSSIGMAMVRNAKDFAAAFHHATQYDETVFAEALVTGAEYTVAIVGEEVLPPIKLETDNIFYDYDAKYVSEDTRYLCPCGLATEDVDRLSLLAKKAFTSVGCSGWGRVDFMADEEGNFYLLEVNSVPGMTSHSLVPMAAKENGVNFQTLCLKILTETL